MDNDVRSDWELKDHFEQLQADLTGYVGNRKNEMMLHAAERTGTISARLVLLLVLLGFAGLILLFSSIALASFLSTLTGSLVLGNLAVAGVYLILALLFLLVWKERLRDIVVLDVVNEIYTSDNES